MNIPNFNIGDFGFYKYEIVIPLAVVKAQGNQIIEYARESNLEVEDIKMRDLEMVLYSNGDKHSIEYFEYLVNSHVRNINKLERIASRK